MFLSVEVGDASVISILLGVNQTEHSARSNLFIFQASSREKKRLLNKLRDQFRNETDKQNAYRFLSSTYY
jgi:ABC-type molybdate transport system substrate-binding protein